MTAQIDIVSLRILLALLAAGGSMLAVGALLRRDWHSLSHRVFAVAMLLVTAEQGSVVMAAYSVSLGDVLFWNQLGLSFAAMAPGAWFFFILSLEPDRPNRVHWAVWLGAAMLVVPLTVSLLFWDQFFWGLPKEPTLGFREIQLDRVGTVLCAGIVLSNTIVLAVIERALRAAIGQTRWRVKFLLLGLAAFSGVRIYTGSQHLLFSQFSTSLQLLDTAGLLVSVALIMLSLRRASVLRFGLHPSQKLLTHSIVLVVVGIYLIGVGLLSRLFGSFEWARLFPVHVLIFFLGLVALGALLLSDRFRHDVRSFASRHLKRPTHDYRDAWRNFTERTARETQAHDLARKVVEFVSERFEVLLVDLWLLREDAHLLQVAASTGKTQPKTQSLALTSSESSKLIRSSVKLPGVLDLEHQELERRSEFVQFEGLLNQQTRYIVPLRAQEAFLGFLTLGPKVRGRPLSVEDEDLLQVIAEQTAASLLGIRLSEALQESRQLEAFQKMSAFFVHDLKNLASRLSLTVQNLPAHFDNPEFREDALHTISDSLERIRRMIGRLSALKERIELSPDFVDLNELLTSTVQELKLQVRNPVEKHFGSLPPARLDARQFRKVVTNLLLNAAEASAEGGTIRISTQAENGSLTLSVRDEGTGMSSEFMEQRLFRPFQTTKKEGVGVGLYHSKMIVEAHDGKIEVQSEPGGGSTFRIYLPIRPSEKQVSGDLK